MPDIAADPFREREGRLLSLPLRLLGGTFVFQTESRELMRLVRWAYADLPAPRLSAAAPRCVIRLAIGEGAKARSPREPTPLTMLSGPGVLCGASSSASAAIVSPQQRAGLVIVERDMLRFPYHVRYELIEFAVFTLAARVQGLIALHAACVGDGRRAVLLTGGSGAGKSTAVLHCALAGLELVSEDSLFVEPRTLLATGVANFLHIRAESLRFLSCGDAARLRRAPVIRRRSGVEKLEIDLRRGRCFRLARAPLEIAAVVHLAPQQAHGEPLLARVGSRESLRRLRESQPYAAAQPGWTAFARRIGGVPAFELRRGRHPRDTVEALRGLIAAPSPGESDRRESEAAASRRRAGPSATSARTIRDGDP
jgi:hypothetical protein